MLHTEAFVLAFAFVLTLREEEKREEQDGDSGGEKKKKETPESIYHVCCEL